LKVTFVEDWRKALRWFSVQASAVNAMFLVTWASLPPKFQDALPVPWVIGIAVALLVLGTFGRLVDQKRKR
jgi:hypothetical protein